MVTIIARKVVYSLIFILSFASCQFEPNHVPAPKSLENIYAEIKKALSEVESNDISGVKEISSPFQVYAKCRSQDSTSSCATELEVLYTQIDALLISDQGSETINTSPAFSKLNNYLPQFEGYEEKIIGKKIRKSYSSLIAPSIFTENCKIDSVTVVQAQDNSAVSILYSDMQLEGAPRTTFKKQCPANINIKIPEGKKAAIYKIDYRGFSRLPKGSNALFKVTYSNGDTKLKPFKRLMKANESDFLFTDRLNPSDFKFFGCGEDINLVATTEVVLENYSQTEVAMASLDSADGTTRQAGISFGIKMTTCR